MNSPLSPLAKGDLPVGNVVVVLDLQKAKKAFSAEFTLSEVEWARNDSMNERLFDLFG